MTVFAVVVTVVAATAMALPFSIAMHYLLRGYRRYR